MSDDPKISQRYRELPGEEPPRALDDAILAASRRAVESRPAPLVAPTGRRRWYVPLAAAAVITLAVAVTLHIQHDKPEEEIDAVSPAMNVQEAPKPEAPKAPAKVEAAKPAAKGQAPRAAPQPFPAERRADVARAPAAAAPAAEPAPPPAAAEVQKRIEEQREMAAASAGARARDEPSAPAQPQMARAAIEQGPDAELERIARLRAAGRHDQADKALAEFRRRYPDYRLSDEMKAKVERRQ